MTAQGPRAVGDDAIVAHAWVAPSRDITDGRPAYLHEEMVAIVRRADLTSDCPLDETLVVRPEQTLAIDRSRWGSVDPATRRPTLLPAAVVRRRCEAP